MGRTTKSSIVETPELLLAIDPGSQHLGASLFNRGELIGARLLEAPRGSLVDRQQWLTARIDQWLGDSDIRSLVIEFPTTYEGRSARGDTNDLLELCALVGGIIYAASRYQCSVQRPYPVQWKGTVPKHITEWRASKTLTDKERSRVRLPSADSYAHNVWDAIGLGLWALGRKPTGTLDTQ